MNFSSFLVFSDVILRLSSFLLQLDQSVCFVVCRCVVFAGHLIVGCWRLAVTTTDWFCGEFRLCSRFTSLPNTQQPLRLLPGHRIRPTFLPVGEERGTKRSSSGTVWHVERSTRSTRVLRYAVWCGQKIQTSWWVTFMLLLNAHCYLVKLEIFWSHGVRHFEQLHEYDF